MPTDGTPAASRRTESCIWHVQHDPQSASATTAAEHRDAISSRSLAGAGCEKVGLTKRSILSPGNLPCSMLPIASKVTEPPGFEMSSRPTQPESSSFRGARTAVSTSPSAAGFSRTSGVWNDTGPVLTVAATGSTSRCTGRESIPDGDPGSPIEKHGMKAENFPASAPATTMWRLSGFRNLGTTARGVNPTADLARDTAPTA
mmetsp:Transcript_3683/g.9204  ORF Transcript_3683/g.9204 Transcript_3683/m.9204 type:complete len:202 (+) Transcript_3683:495-1100(+)